MTACAPARADPNRDTVRLASTGREEARPRGPGEEPTTASPGPAKGGDGARR